MLLLSWLCVPIACGQSHRPETDLENPADSLVSTELRLSWAKQDSQALASGTVSISDGRISIAHTQLGNGLADLGWITQDGRALSLQIPAHRSEGYIDLRVDSRLDADLRIDLAVSDHPSRTRAVLKMDGLMEAGWRDENSSIQLAITRMPHDQIRVRSSTPSLVRETGTIWNTLVSGFHTGAAAGPQTLKVHLVGSDGTQQLIEQRPVLADSTGSFSETELSIHVPEQAGVYQLAFSLQPQRSLKNLLSSTSHIVRRIDFIAFDPEQSRPRFVDWLPLISIHAYSASRPGIRAWIAPVSNVAERAVPQRLQQLNPLAGANSGPFIGGVLSARKPQWQSLYESAGECLELASGAWIAFPLGRLEPGLPHRLRLRLPDDQPQDLVVSLVSQEHANAMGQHMPEAVGKDHRIVIDNRECSDRASLREFEFLFWPTDQMSVLLANGDGQLATSIYDLQVERAVLAETMPSGSGTGSPFADIPNRLTSGPSSDPDQVQTAQGSTSADDRDQRQLLVSRSSASANAANIEALKRPLATDQQNRSVFDTADKEHRHAGIFLELPPRTEPVTTSFGVLPAAFENPGNQTWRTWEKYCQQVDLVLEQTQANLLVLEIDPVDHPWNLADDIRASQEFHDLSLIRDGPPTWHDYVDLVIGHCQRANVALVLALKLSTPLPGLSEGERRLPAESDSIYQVTLEGERDPQRYDPLHPAVQESLFSLLDRVLDRYGKHPAFRGIQLRLDRESQLTFMGDRWGYDAKLLSQFSSETKIELPYQDQRKPAVLSANAAQAFLRWRASKLTEFYRSLSARIASSNPQAQLFLNPTRLWATPPTEREFRQPITIVRYPEDYMLALGIDAKTLRKMPDVVFLQGQLLQHVSPVNSEAWIREVAQNRGLSPTEVSADSWLAAIIDQRATEFRLENADPQHLRFTSTDTFDLRPISYSRSLSLRNQVIDELFQSDLQWLACGLRLPVTNQLDDLQQVFSTLREFPPLTFQDATQNWPVNPSGAALPAANGTNLVKPTKLALRGSNVRLRIGQSQQKTYIQIINNASWPEELTLTLSQPVASTDIRRLGAIENQSTDSQPESKRTSTTIQLSLEPYDLQGVEISAANVEIRDIERRLPDQLMQRVQSELSALESLLAIASSRQTPWANVFGGFEQWDATGLPFAWQIDTAPQTEFSRSAELPHSGRGCLRITQHSGQQSDQGKTALLRSRPFDVPPTGRLAIQAWLRCSAADPTAVVRIALRGERSDGSPYEQAVTVGSRENRDLQIPNDWGTRPVTLYASDIPLEELESLYVAIEMLGAGTVWIDDVQVLKNWLRPDERIYLQGLMLVASEQLAANNPFPAEQLLNSHWGRFLSRYCTNADVADKDAIGESEQAADIPSATQPSQDSVPRTGWNSSPGLMKQMRDAWRERWRR
ncbi:MAG: family 10 glycosylhydrolase [bacterium]|nr:family 10 glycosylhydrolase [bacterium]